LAPVLIFGISKSRKGSGKRKLHGPEFSDPPGWIRGASVLDLLGLVIKYLNSRSLVPSDRSKDRVIFYKEKEVKPF